MDNETSIKQMLVKIVQDCMSPTMIEEGIIIDKSNR